ncbi:MAG: S8 family peptidase [Bacteroidales bacterium]|nr:S8 family peptidase [Bacteroidales bacterium]
MKRKILYVLAFCVVSSISAQNELIGPYSIYEENNEHYLLLGNDTLLLDDASITVKFQDTLSENDKYSFQQLYNLNYVRETIGNYINYELSVGSGYEGVCDSIYNDNRISEFIFDYVINFHIFTPNDDDLSEQWYLETIDAYDAWDITVGSENIIVAVLDEGLFLDHDDVGDDEEILENVYHHSGEDEWDHWDSPSTGNDIDDDGNGKIDDWKGWNFYNWITNHNIIEDNNVIPEVDLGDHGTAVSGIIAAKTNNNEDIAGIAGGNFAQDNGGVKILPIKISDWKENPLGTWVRVSSSDVIPSAIQYAIEMNANIINMSWGIFDLPPGMSENINTAIEEAHDNNILFVSAAGNTGGSITYPALHDDVIAVGATTTDDELWEYSAYGQEIELTAPGVNIISLDNLSTEYYDGTSLSSPMVAATAALALSVNHNLTNIELRDILKNTAEKVGDHAYDENGWNQYFGFGRINAYQTICESLQSLPQIIVETDKLWNDPKYSLNDIIIEAGATLTISSTVYMGSNAKIIVKPTGKLIVDEGTLTNIKGCGHENNMWLGVEVWGNSSEHQYTLNGYNAQGQVILKNNAIIENAVSAIELWRPGHYETTGGVVYADNAIFRNNAKSVHALYYTNFNPFDPQEERDNLSSFENCIFEITSDYLATETFYKHVDLTYVDGIDFKASDFSVINTNGVSQWNNGIASYNAGFNVLAICTTTTKPCSDYDGCTFNGFNNAIYASGPSNHTFYVSRAIFDNNAYGIKVEGLNNYTVLFSEFYIGYNSADEQECGSLGLSPSGYGISSSNSTGFAIEENYFTKVTGAPTGNYTGIRIEETEAADEIYKNEFVNLNYGNYAVGKNWEGASIYRGLAYYCNNNLNNNLDFYIPYDEFSGIQSNQGSVNNPTGNKFQSTGHFYNGGVHWINYYYCSNCDNEYPDLVYHITPLSTTAENECISHYGGTSGEIRTVLSEDEKLVVEEDYAQAYSNYNNTMSLFDDLKDGGNTETMVFNIETAWPDETWELRSELLGSSPHLSQEALMTAADKTDVLPESVIFEILSANPDELKKEELIYYLEEKEDPLPDYMINILREMAAGTTYKTALLAQMAEYNRIKIRAAHDMIRSILNDTVSNYSEFRSWLDNIGGLKADMQIIETFLAENNYSDAIALAEMLPVNYNLEGAELIEHNTYLEMLNFRISLEQQNMSILELDSADINLLEVWAVNNKGMAGSWAKGILESFYDHHFCECLNVDTSQGFKYSNNYSNRIGKSIGFNIQVAPNPAKLWTEFIYTLPVNASKGMVKISDATGKIVYTFRLTGKKGKHIWDTSKIKNGLYFYTVNVNGEIKSGRLVIAN